MFRRSRSSSRRLGRHIRHLFCPRFLCWYSVLFRLQCDPFGTHDFAVVTVAGQVSCTTCQESLQAPADGQDLLIGLLRQPAPRDEYAAEPARGRLAATAAGGGRTTTVVPDDRTWPSSTWTDGA